MAIQIGLRPADDDPARRELSGHETRILQPPDADGEIPPLVDQVDVAVGKPEIDRDRGIEAGEIGQGRCDLDESRRSAGR